MPSQNSSEREPLISRGNEASVRYGTTDTSTQSGQDRSPDVDPDNEEGDWRSTVWLQESSKRFQRTWIPSRLRRLGQALAQWTEGPHPPHLYRISPLFPTIQEAPARLVDTNAPKRKRKIAILILFYTCWLLTFSLVLHHSAKAGDIQGYGKPDSIWCGASVWGPNNDCGLNGNRCRPFDDATLAFRCPANCRATRVLDPHAIGDLEVDYVPYVIGGPQAHEENSTLPDTIYRGDSFICQAAIHSGIVGNDKGGCGVAVLTGEQTNFTSTERHQIRSFPFDSSFPKTFTFMTGVSSHCVRDLRWPLLAVTCGFTTILSVFTTSAPVFFFSIFIMLFFHVGLVSDPPSHADYPSLISLIVGRFLPAAFIAAAFYRYSVQPQHRDLTATIERTILWLGGAWVGALNNYTFDHIPIERLTPHDLHAQPGAVLALIIIVLLLFFIALQQAWFLRQEGRFRKYLGIYTAMIAGLLLCVAIPQLNLRLHHYFLAILLLPGTRTQTRPSLLYQGILVGLFINGASRWGFDSILQTALELRGSDGQQGTILPQIAAPLIGLSTISFNWTRPPSPFDGISVLVNDVERHIWYYGEGAPAHTFKRHRERERQYFRFAYMQGSGTGDYTKAAIWEVDGNWTKMEPGPS